MAHWYVYNLYDEIYTMILYDDEMSWGYGDGYTVLQAPMDGSVIDVVYRETMIHSIEVV